MAAWPRKTVRYISDIPWDIRKNLCDKLDGSGEWKRLATKVPGITNEIVANLSLQQLGGVVSPTDRILTTWGYANARLIHLVKVLIDLNLIQPLKSLHSITSRDVQMEISRVLGGEEHDELGVKENNNQRPPTSGHTANYNPFYSFGNKPDLPGPEEFHGGVPNFQTYPGRPQQNSDGIKQNHLVVNIPRAESCHIVKGFSTKKGKMTSQHSFEGITPKFSYRQLEEATDNFSEANLLGQGGFGNVYKGTVHCNVKAIKVFKEGLNKDADSVVSVGSSNIMRHFKADIASLERYRSDHILPLYGYSDDGPLFCLVFQYMSNGSLEDRIQCKNNTPPLTWIRRHKILTDAARGLQFIHDSTEGLMHGDIKSANILLSHDWQAKLCDFGLARPECRTDGSTYTRITSETCNDPVYGTQAYLPENFYQGHAKYHKEDDIYSFGVVIFETCTGERATNPNRKDTLFLKDYVREMLGNNGSSRAISLKDKKACDWPDTLWKELLEIGIQCTSRTKKRRPKNLLLLLEKLVVTAQLDKCNQANFVSPLKDNGIFQEGHVGAASISFFNTEKNSRKDKSTNNEMVNTVSKLKLENEILSKEYSEWDQDDIYLGYDKNKLPEFEESNRVMDPGVDVKDIMKVQEHPLNSSLFEHDKFEIKEPTSIPVDFQTMKHGKPYVHASTFSATSDIACNKESCHVAKDELCDPEYYDYDKSKLEDDFSPISDTWTHYNPKPEDISLPYRLQKEFDEAKEIQSNQVASFHYPNINKSAEYTQKQIDGVLMIPPRMDDHTNVSSYSKTNKEVKEPFYSEHMQPNDEAKIIADKTKKTFIFLDAFDKQNSAKEPLSTIFDYEMNDPGCVNDATDKNTQEKPVPQSTEKQLLCSKDEQGKMPIYQSAEDMGIRFLTELDEPNIHEYSKSASNNFDSLSHMYHETHDTNSFGSSVTIVAGKLLNHEELSQYTPQPHLVYQQAYRTPDQTDSVSDSQHREPVIHDEGTSADEMDLCNPIEGTKNNQKFLEDEKRIMVAQNLLKKKKELFV